ncbi:MAG: hypothetical protein ABI887_14615 [Burkholderiales bacterium]
MSGDYDENQVHVPDSFIALYRDTRNRLTAPRETIAARYELCEDLANLLTDHCSMVHFRDGVDEATVLQRCHQGLLVPPTTVEAPEAEWVVRRTAELLGWPGNWLTA